MCDSVESLNSDPSRPYPVYSGSEQTIGKALNTFFVVVYALTSGVGICLSVAESKGENTIYF